MAQGAITHSLTHSTATLLASPADILRLPREGEGTRDARLRMSAGETTSLRLGYNAAYGAISHQILPMSDEVLPAVGHEDRTNQIPKTATLKPSYSN